MSNTCDGIAGIDGARIPIIQLWRCTTKADTTGIACLHAIADVAIGAGSSCGDWNMEAGTTGAGVRCTGVSVVTRTRTDCSCESVLEVHDCLGMDLDVFGGQGSRHNSMLLDKDGTYPFTV